MITKLFSIRFATINDVDLIHRFIVELATYEKLAHEVVATPDLLKKTLFGPRKTAEVIIAEEANKPIGFALFFHNFSTFLGKPGIYLEDLYIVPEARSKGYGKQMLSHLARIAKERNCGRLEWWVLDWNEPAISFYKKIGAVPMEDWTVHRVTGEALDHLANSKFTINQ